MGFIMNQKTGNLAITPLITATHTEKKFDVKRLKVTNALQTTLATDRLIALFSEQIKPFVKQTGLEYQNESGEIEIAQGKSAPHSCTYNLILEDEELGNLKLMRRKRFSPTEIEQIEALLCCLIYPLRNALMYKKALQSAHTDELTGLNNRLSFNQSLQHEWDLAQRYDAPFSVLMLDIDHFKKINDTHGHAIGDDALVAIARAIKETIRDSDIAFRYGGEEFVVLLNKTTEPGASLLAERIRKNIANLLIPVKDSTIKLTASLGSATLNSRENGEELLKRADDALYKAKKEGRDRVISAG